MNEVRLEFALGEVCNLGPLIALGIVPQPEIDPKGITGKEKWNAQGLEGKAFVMVNLVVADMLLRRLTRLRSLIV